MNEKEILTMALYGAKEQLRQKCEDIAEHGNIYRKTLENLRHLIEYIEELDEKLEIED